MLYLVLKAFHVAAFTAWMAGMIVVPLVIANGRGASSTLDKNTLLALRTLLSRVTTPAMLASLGLGLWLAQEAGWFRAAWLQLKLCLVLVLTGLHGLIAGQVRRLAAEPGGQAALILPALPWLVLACIIGIALLAVVKPQPW